MQENTAKKLKRIQTLFDAGKTHTEIAKELGYTKIESFYRFIYRYNDSLKYKKQFSKKDISVVPEIKQEEEIPAKKAVNTILDNRANISKVESIVSLIDRGIDLREIAQKKHFKDVQDLADYMRSKGYLWNGEKKNYILVPQEIRTLPEMPVREQRPAPMAMNKIREIMGKNNEGDCECLKVYGDTLKWLDENKGRLLGLLNGELNKGEIPRYILSGNIKTKSMKINDILERLVYDFSQEKNISQKDIIQAALIEFLKKYGYEHDVKVSLQI